MSIHNRIGIFRFNDRIQSELSDRQFSDLCHQAQLWPIRTQKDWSTLGATYTARSPNFEDRDPGAPIPWYIIQFSIEKGEITNLKITKQEDMK